MIRTIIFLVGVAVYTFTFWILSKQSLKVLQNKKLSKFYAHNPKPINKTAIENWTRLRIRQLLVLDRNFRKVRNLCYFVGLSILIIVSLLLSYL